jgi:hypothetical protein
MKRLLKVVGIFVSFLLGSLLIANASMSSLVTSASMPYKGVYVGETVGFNLTAMFGNLDDPKEIWVVYPGETFDERVTLTNTAMFVIFNVQLEDGGIYTFYAENYKGRFEYRVTLYVMEPEPDYGLVSVNLSFFQELTSIDVSFFALKPDDEIYFV